MTYRPNIDCLTDSAHPARLAHLTRLAGLVGAVLLAGLLVAAGVARAEETAGGSCSQAKDCLESGLKASQSGDQAAALAFFQRGNQLEPSRLALYHIALTYQAMGKPVEAEDAFDKVLSDTGPLKAEYLKRARAGKQEQQAKVGVVDVKVTPPAALAASITIDGQRAGETPLQKPVRVAQGEHEVSVTAPGYLTAKQTATVPGQGRTELTFDLQPDPAKLAQVTVASSLPGAEVRVDEEVAGTTPLAAPVKLAPGKHTIELRRAGYMDGYRQVNLGPGARVTVAFNPDEDEGDGADRGRLVVTTDGATAVRISIDGRARGVYSKPIKLPVGPHLVGLSRPDCDPIERKVEVRAHADTQLDAGFGPSKRSVAEEESREHARKTWSTAAIVTGGVVAAGSIALLVWGQSQLPSAQDKLTQVQQDAAPGGGGGCDPARLNPVTTPFCQANLASAQDNVDKYRHLRLAGIIGTSAGAILVGVGVALRLVHPDSAQENGRDVSSLPLEPVLSAGPEGATAGLRGRF